MLFTLLGLPIDGFKFVFKTLQRVAEEQYVDDAPLKERLLELQLALENGEITEAQYAEEEAEVFRGLREIDERKRELAGAPSLEEERGEGISGQVAEGSGAEVTFAIETAPELSSPSAATPPPKPRSKRGDGRRAPQRTRRGR